MTYDGTGIQKVHLDEVVGEDRPYSAKVLETGRNNARYLNRERGIDHTQPIYTQAPADRTRIKQIRPFSHLSDSRNENRPTHMSIWRTPILLPPGIKDIEVTLWHRVSDRETDLLGRSDPSELEAVLSTPGAKSADSMLNPTTLTASKVADDISVWQADTLSTRIARSYSASIQGWAEALLSLDIRSFAVPESEGSGVDTTQNSRQPARMTAADWVWDATISSDNPVIAGDAWTSYLAFDGAPDSNILWAPRPNDAIAVLDSNNFRRDVGQVTDGDLTYIQIRTMSIRTTFYDMSERVAGADITDEETRAEQSATGDTPQGPIRKLRDIDKRPQLLCAGTKGVADGSSSHWGFGVAHEMHRMHPSHEWAPGTDSEGSYATLYDETGRAPANVDRIKFAVMALPLQTAEDDNKTDFEWGDQRVGVTADITFKSEVWERRPSGDTLIFDDTHIYKSQELFLTNRSATIPILQHHDREFRKYCFKEGYLDCNPYGQARDLEKNDPHANYLWPYLFGNISSSSGWTGEHELRFVLRVKGENKTPEDPELFISTVNTIDTASILCVGFSVWGL